MTTADHLGLVPAPVRAATRAGSAFVAVDTLEVRTDQALRLAARWWSGTVSASTGIDVAVVTSGAVVAAVTPAAAAAPAANVAPAAAGTVTFRLRGSESPRDDGSAEHGERNATRAPRGGGYRLTVDSTGVVVEADDLPGAFAAAQTLRQLAGPDASRRAPLRTGRPRLTLPPVEVDDAPRHAWRGVLLDVARHFMPVHDVLRFVDLVAAHKLNVLQLHLTDDQGWRVQVLRHPRLTEVGGWRTATGVGTWRTGLTDGQPHGGWYTQDDLREIVAYARERGVVVVPEIDVPGHVEAAVAAYPELGTRKQPHEVRTTSGVSTEVLDPSEATLAFFREVLDEVLDVFDGPWVALGGDEVPTTLWLENPAVVERAAALGLPDARHLHGWFVDRLCEHVIAAGRRPVVWDEAFTPSLPTETVVTAWRGITVGARAIEAGHDVVMAPEQVVYLDHRAGDHPDEPTPVGFLRTVADVYGFDPLPAAVRAEHPGLERAPGRLAGVQAQVWTEHLDSPRRVDFATFPRLAAFAEVAWSPAADRAPGSEASEEFLERLRTSHLPRLDAAGVEYRPLDGPLPWQARPGAEGYPRDLDAEMAAAGWAGAGGWHEGDSQDDERATAQTGGPA